MYILISKHQEKNTIMTHDEGVDCLPCQQTIPQTAQGNTLCHKTNIIHLHIKVKVKTRKTTYIGHTAEQSKNLYYMYIYSLCILP